MNTASSMPRFRTDLVTTPIEEAGQRFIDVTDPDSGSTFRFYEVEYAIACAMEGELDVNGLARWALEELGLETSPSELETVITTLDELGYLESSPASAPASARQPAEDAFGDEIALGAPGGTSSVVEPMPASPVAAAAEMELGAPGRSPITRARPPAPSAESIELGAPGGVEAPSTLGSGSPLDQSFEGLLEDEPPTAVRPAPVQDDAPTSVHIKPPPDDDFGLDGLTPPPAEVPSAKLRPVTETPMADDDGPTNLPPAIPGLDDDPEVSVDLSEHLSIDASDVKEAVRQSQVMNAVEVPEELLAELSGGTSANAEPAMIVDAAPQAVEPVGSAPVELPAAPVKVSERDARPAVEADPVTEPKKSGVSGFLLFLLLLAVAGGGAYWYFMVYKKGQEADSGATVTAPTGPKDPSTGPVTPPRPAAIKARLEQRTAESVEVTMPAAGAVTFAVEDGAEVSAGDVLASLKGAERFERKVQATIDRKAYYQNKLDKAKEKLDGGDATQQANVEAFTKKVEEKTNMIAGYQEDLAKLRITAPVSGPVTVVGKAGWLKGGETLFEIGGASSLFAVFELPAGRTVEEGAVVKVVPAADPAAEPVECTAVAVAAPKATVECQLDSGLQAGADVVLK